MISFCILIVFGICLRYCRIRSFIYWISVRVCFRLVFFRPVLLLLLLLHRYFVRTVFISVENDVIEQKSKRAACLGCGKAKIRSILNLSAFFLCCHDHFHYVYFSLDFRHVPSRYQHISERAQFSIQPDSYHRAWETSFWFTASSTSWQWLLTQPAPSRPT